MERIIYALIMVFSFSIPLFAQSTGGTLEVLIENAEEDEIYGAEVCVYIHERLVTKGFADPTGFLLISSLSPGFYTVEIKTIGFFSSSYQIEIATNQTRTIQTTLKESIISTYTIISETIREPLLQDKYGWVNSWDNEEILKMPVR